MKERFMALDEIDKHFVNSNKSIVFIKNTVYKNKNGIHKKYYPQKILAYGVMGPDPS